MKKDLHPTYYSDAVVVCACGNTWTTGSTLKEIRTDICSNCHPFYTGEQRIVDTEGQVDRFYKRLQARQEHMEEEQAREDERTTPDRPIKDLDVSKRAIEILANNDITNAGEFLARLENGDNDLLAIDGFGRKSLADVKKRLRQLGYTIPEVENAVV